MVTEIMSMHRRLQRNDRKNSNHGAKYNGGYKEIHKYLEEDGKREFAFHYERQTYCMRLSLCNTHTQLFFISFSSICVFIRSHL